MYPRLHPHLLILLTLCTSSALATTAPLGKPIQIVFYAKVPQMVGGQLSNQEVVKTLELGQARSGMLRQAGKVSDNLKNDLSRWAKSLERDPQNVRFERTKAGWKVVQQNGWKIDLEATYSALAQVINDPAKGQVKVVFSEKQPFRNLEFFRSRGILGHIGEGITRYRGSTRARMTNIHVGAGHFNDTLFEGKVFSFNKIVGSITRATGFVEGLVISGDQTQAGVGGGICQVSTTVFRSLYRAGLPLLERRNHRYQVSYYSPLGLDATIYQPSQDLKFTNDTGGSIWFQSTWNDRRRRLEVQAFGSPRAEKVSVTGPVLLASRRSPPDKYIFDRNMRVGAKEQVDWAVPGATVEVHRTFKDAKGKVTKSEILRSVYVPWPNIFKVGPTPAPRDIPKNSDPKKTPSPSSAPTPSNPTPESDGVPPA